MGGASQWRNGICMSLRLQAEFLRPHRPGGHALLAPEFGGFGEERPRRGRRAVSVDPVPEKSCRNTCHRERRGHIENRLRGSMVHGSTMGTSPRSSSLHEIQPPPQWSRGALVPVFGKAGSAFQSFSHGLVDSGSRERPAESGQKGRQRADEDGIRGGQVPGNPMRKEFAGHGQRNAKIGEEVDQRTGRQRDVERLEPEQKDGDVGKYPQSRRSGPRDSPIHRPWQSR